MNCQGAQDVTAKWNFAHRVAFRFAFLYLGLYNVVVLTNTSQSIMPGLSHVMAAYGRLWHTIVPWVGQNILRLDTPITYFLTGSGDGISEWVTVLCYLAIAVVGTVVWSILDRPRPNYRFLLEWLRVWVRYSLAFTMVLYGIIKVIKLQFPDPSLARLVEPLGEFSPMGLLWTFMGASVGYTFFGGAAEVLGGLLFFFRRTTTLGALVAGAVVLNIAVMNLCYDVPVKLLSIHLCFMCLFLIAPELGRLLNVLVLNRSVAPIIMEPHFRRPWIRYSSWAVKTALVGFAIFSNASSALRGESDYGRKAPKPPIYGIWEVEEFTRDGEVVPPLLTDVSRWKTLIAPSKSGITIRTMNDSTHLYSAEYDGILPAVRIVPRAAGSVPVSRLNTKNDTLTWQRTDADHLVVTGKVGPDFIVARMRRIDESKFTLLNRGFHWVSEYPFNR